MFDPEQVFFNGIQLLAVIFGLVEFCKSIFAMQGKAVTVLSALMGAILMVAFQLVCILPDVYAQVLDIALKSIVFGLAASGFYKFANNRLPAVIDKRDISRPYG